MTGLLLSAVLTLVTGQTLACEQLEVQVGQVTCLTGCERRAEACPGQDPVFCPGAVILHPDMVLSVRLASSVAAYQLAVTSR